MFTVSNCGHQHSTVHEAKVCLGMVAPLVPIKAYSPPVSYKDQPGTMSPKQARLLGRLGAADHHLVGANGRRLSMNEASKLIDDFKAGRISMGTSRQVTLDPKLLFVREMLVEVNDGYYAVSPDAETPLTFLRISTPKTGQYKDARKIQTQHSDDLTMRAVFWPSGAVDLFSGFRVEQILLVISDPYSAAIRYGRELHYCCRCRKALTDERSRHYGIGPECEKHWPHIISRVDEEYALGLA